MLHIDDSLLRLSLDEQLEQLRQTESKNPQQNPIDRYLNLAKHYYLSNSNSNTNTSEAHPWQIVLQAGCKFNPKNIQSTAHQFQLISQVLYLSWFSNNRDQQMFSNFANYLFHLVPINDPNDERLINPNYNAIHGFILLNNWELTKSLDKFQLALYHSPTHYAALMGRAMVKMQLREYNTALTLFQDCYKLIVSLPGRQHLRVGDPRPFIAICLVLLDQPAKAKNLFQILSDESPQNPEYKLYLALLEWNQIKISLRHTRSKASASAITNDDELKLLVSLENGAQIFASQSSDMSPPDLHNFIKVTHETLHQNPQHPLSNFMVAEYLYHLGNYSKAAQFFKTVLANSNYFSSQHLVVDSAYYLGMCHFCSGSLIQAYELFEKTIQLDRAHPLAHFGLAQILLSRGKYQEALSTLEKIKFDIHYKSPDCQVLLIGLESLVTNLVEINKQLAAKKDPYPAQLPKAEGIAERVRPLFQIVLKLIDEAKEKKLESPWLSRAFKVLVEIGKYYMTTNPPLSRTAFFNSLQILVSGKVNGITRNTSAYGELEIGILNNLGFVHLNDDVEVSLKYFKTALDRLKKYENPSKNMKGYEVTLKNNIGNCLARLEQFDESKEYLNEIIENYPKYTNASLTLSHSYYLENKLDEACQVLKDAEQALNSSEKPQSDCRAEGLYTYLGHFETVANKHEQGFQHHQTNLKRARDHFTKQKLREIPNIRSLIEVGNYYLNLAHHSTDKDQKWTYCVKANNHFKKAINQNPKALYAVHGVAIAFHLMGLYEDSLLIHERLQQEAYPPVLFQIGYANLLIDMEKGDLAIDVLEKAFKRDPSQKNPENLIALSKAYYICSQQINDLSMLTKAEDILTQLLEEKPKSRRIKYNLALVRHKYCKAIKRMSPSELPEGQKTLKDALAKLQDCQAMFKELLEMGNSSNNNALFKVKFVLDIVNYNEDVQRGLIASLMKVEKLPELRVQNDSNANSPQLLEGLMADEEDKDKNNNNSPPSPGTKRALEVEESKEQTTEENEAKLAKTEE